MYVRTIQAGESRATVQVSNSAAQPPKPTSRYLPTQNSRAIVQVVSLQRLLSLCLSRPPGLESGLLPLDASPLPLFSPVRTSPVWPRRRRLASGHGAPSVSSVPPRVAGGGPSRIVHTSPITHTTSLVRLVQLPALPPPSTAGLQKRPGDPLVGANRDAGVVAASPLSPANLRDRSGNITYGRCRRRGAWAYAREIQWAPTAQKLSPLRTPLRTTTYKAFLRQRCTLTLHYTTPQTAGIRTVGRGVRSSPHTRLCCSRSPLALWSALSKPLFDFDRLAGRQALGQDANEEHLVAATLPDPQPRSHFTLSPSLGQEELCAGPHARTGTGHS